jgi:Domain of unknown function (DUF4190)
MKRCPTCNRTFEEDWLAFCTQDGATLIDESPARADEPPPTILAPPPPPAGGWQQPSGGFGSGQFQSQPIPPPAPPSNVGGSSGGFSPGQYQPPQQMQSGWQPPPPPPYAQGSKQGLAIASMVCGIFTITIGWCCYLGAISALPAIGLGIYQLIQIKNDPEHNTGKPFAIVGIATGAVYYVLIAIIIVIYGAALLGGGLMNK